MKYLKQFGIILILSFAGELLNLLIPLPIPASIWGFALMFVCLQTGLLKLDYVKDTAIFLIEIMPLITSEFMQVTWYSVLDSHGVTTQEQLDDFCELLAEHRALPDGFMDTMNAPSPNIMNKMQRCVLGLYSYDEHAEDLPLENILNQSINLIASMPTMMVNAYQMKRR